MVRLAVKRRRLSPACCNLEVVKGGGANRRFSFCATLETCQMAFCTAARMRCASASSGTSMSSPLYLISLASKDGGSPAAGGKTAAHFVPQERRNFIAHDAIENATGLLRIH